MSRNVSLPDDLATEAKRAGLNISSLAQEAIRSSLTARSLKQMAAEGRRARVSGIGHAKVIEGVNTAEDELERG